MQAVAVEGVLPHDQRLQVVDEAAGVDVDRAEGGAEEGVALDAASVAIVTSPRRLSPVASVELRV